MQSEATLVTEDGTTESLVDAAPEAANAFTNQAMEAIRAVTDGDVSSVDLMQLWTFIGWPIVKVIILVLAVLFVAAWAKRLVIAATKRASVETTLAMFLGNIMRWAVMLLGAIAVLQTLGIEATSFTAVLAALGFAIGMALSGTLSHVASGIMLLIFRPFHVGDAVNAAGVTGAVKEIGLFNTSIDTPDNRRIIVPNGAIFGSNIENITFHDTRRCDVAVGTDYGADLQQTREILLEAARSIPQGLKDPEPAVVLTGLGASSVDWAVRMWVNTGDFWPAKDALTVEVKDRLDNAGIGIPFPQMDVHMQNAV